MAWIESHQDLLDHPKILRLSRTLGVSKNEAIGVAHRFWWWALKYAEDGDLRRFNDDDLAHAVELNGRGKDYFRPEYLEQADVVVIHDPGSDGDIQHSFDLLSQVLMAKKTAGIQKGQLVVMEKTTPYDGNGFSGGSLLPKEMWNRELTGPFGHCGGYKGVGEVEGCHFKTAQLIDLNDLSLQTLVQAAPNAAALSFKLFRPEMRPSIATP